jgi:protein phosphatase PTC2/3
VPGNNCLILYTGRLALSRALGDFKFSSLFTHIGIWDCLSSQAVFDFIRLKAYEGMRLGEIGESMCDFCVSPIAGGLSKGCDNMTILIVAILNGRTKEEWYTWMHNRVESRYGYPTPPKTPEIYHPDEVEEAREEAIKRRDKKYGLGTGSTINDNGSDFVAVLQALNCILDTGNGGAIPSTGSRSKDGSYHFIVSTTQDQVDLEDYDSD